MAALVPSGSDGPYLEMAVLCERVLEERDGALSLIRLVDRFTIHRPAPAPGEYVVPPSISVVAVVGFKSGAARGRHQLRLSLEYPDGMIHSRLEVPLLLEGEDRGARALVPIQLLAEQEGIYWIRVALDEAEFTRVPLRVAFFEYRADGQ